MRSIQPKNKNGKTKEKEVFGFMNPMWRKLCWGIYLYIMHSFLEKNHQEVENYRLTQRSTPTTFSELALVGVRRRGLVGPKCQIKSRQREEYPIFHKKKKKIKVVFTTIKKQNKILHYQTPKRQIINQKEKNHLSLILFLLFFFI